MQGMHEATVTITNKYAPDKGKTMWKLLTASGEKFLVMPTEQQYYQEGETYTLNYTSSDFNGRTYHTAKGAPTPAGGKKQPAFHPGGASNGRQMFICAIVKEWIPKIPVAETTTLISAIQSAMDAYDQTFGHVE